MHFVPVSYIPDRRFPERCDRREPEATPRRRPRQAVLQDRFMRWIGTSEGATRLRGWLAGGRLDRYRGRFAGAAPDLSTDRLPYRPEAASDPETTPGARAR